jgi:tRNA A-37 threonylcarbamoyl transferase component Bud32
MKSLFSMNRDISISYVGGAVLNGKILTENSCKSSVIFFGEKIFETKSSIILKLNDGDIIKCLKLRHWTEYYKIFLGKNRAYEEVFSNYEMKRIGLNVPDVKYYGVFSNIFSKRLFTSFYAMQPIPFDYQPGNVVFRNLEYHAKEHFIREISFDIAKLRKCNYVYSDLSLRNLLVNRDGDYYWIDTQVKSYKLKIKFKKKFNHSLERFINDEKLTICAEEKSTMLDNLLAG